MASEQLQTIIQTLRSRRTSGQDLDIIAARTAFEGVTSFFPTPDDVTCEKVDADGVPGEWISAPGADPETVVYYLHGGAYSVGSVNSHRQLIANISRATGARAFAIDYRLAPENPFPAAIEDATKAYRWLLNRGIDPARVVLAGDSAGGGLAAATLLSLRDAGDPLPAAAVLISPWTDMEGLGESMKTKADVDPMIAPDTLGEGASAYLGGADPRNPLASPIHADLSGLPPMLIQVGGSEVLLDDSTRLAAKAEADGVDVTLEVWDEMIHVWHFFAVMLPEGQQAIDRIAEFLRQHVPAIARAT
ncbi:MAG: alpha/beta hydrolase [Chloroflexi bacterium]|nr:alpha/beta hydrolase [Chloroflexota bacterium]